MKGKLLGGIDTKIDRKNRPTSYHYSRKDQTNYISLSGTLLLNWLSYTKYCIFLGEFFLKDTLLIFTNKILRIILLSMFGIWFVYQTVQDLSYDWEVSVLLIIDSAGILVYVWTIIKDRNEYKLSQKASSFLPTAVGLFFILTIIGLSYYQKTLVQNRFNALINDYYSKPYDTNFVGNIVPSNDSSVDGQLLYQCLVDDSKTKFIAFYLGKAVPKDFTSLNEFKNDKNVNIISNKDINDPGYLNDLPQIYAYIVKGVRHSDKWYYQKSNVTYFDANNVEDSRQRFFNSLQGWGFFEGHSTRFNPDFWETNHFQKIKDLTKDPEWSKYGNTVWKVRERENRNFIGMYEIIADELKRQQKEKYDAFDSLMSKNIFTPFYELQIKNNPAGFAKYSGLYGILTLIYPKKMDVVINPVMITNSKGRKSLHFYLSFVDKRTIYEWTYFQPKVIRENEWHYGSVILDQLSTITEWDYSYRTLDDKIFWETYVLAKAGNDFIYLKQLK